MSRGEGLRPSGVVDDAYSSWEYALPLSETLERGVGYDGPRTDNDTLGARRAGRTAVLHYKRDEAAVPPVAYMDNPGEFEEAAPERSDEQGQVRLEGPYGTWQDLRQQHDPYEGLTPWQRGAEDRQSAWGEVLQVASRVLPERIRPHIRSRWDATPGMAWESAVFLTGTYVKHLFDVVTFRQRVPREAACQEAPQARRDRPPVERRRTSDVVSAVVGTAGDVAAGFAGVALSAADRAISGLEYVVYSAGRHLRRTGNHIGETRVWHAAEQVADTATGYALYGVLVGGAATLLFLSNPWYYIGPEGRAERRRVHASLDNLRFGSSVAARGEESAHDAAHTTSLHESDRQLAALIDRQRRHVEIDSSWRSDDSVPTPQSLFSQTAWPLVRAHLGRINLGEADSPVLVATRETIAAVIRQISDEPQAFAATTHVYALDISKSLAAMFPETESGCKARGLSLKDVVATVLERLGVGDTDIDRRLDVLALMADHLSQFTLPDMPPASNPPVAGSPATAMAPRSAPEHTIVNDDFIVPFMRILAYDQQRPASANDDLWQGAQRHAAIIREDLVAMGFETILTELDEVTNVNDAIATALVTEGLVSKKAVDDGDVSSIFYAGTYNTGTIDTIAACLRAYHYSRVFLSRSVNGGSSAEAILPQA